MKRNKAFLLLAFTVALLIFGNPPEKHFLNILSKDFGQNHGGMTLESGDLARLGSGAYQSYLFFSKYEYTFGNISVEYLGVGFMTFYLGSNIQSKEKELITHNFM